MHALKAGEQVSESVLYTLYSVQKRLTPLLYLGASLVFGLFSTSLFPSEVWCAFLLLVLIQGIWAILGVQFFGDPSQTNVDHSEHFGTFSRAMLTLFQICTFDDWAAVVRAVTINEGRIFLVYFMVCGAYLARTGECTNKHVLSTYKFHCAQKPV